MAWCLRLTLSVVRALVALLDRAMLTARAPGTSGAGEQ